MDIDIERLKRAVAIVINDKNRATWDEKSASVYLQAVGELVEVANSVIDGTIFASEEEVYEICLKWYHQYCNTARLKPLAHALSHKIPTPSSALTRELLRDILSMSWYGGYYDEVGDKQHKKMDEFLEDNEDFVNAILAHSASAKGDKK